MTDASATARPDGFSSAIDLVNAIARGKLRAQEVMEDCLARIAQVDPTIHAFVDIQAENARAAAQAADNVPADMRGPLHGLPVAIKEVFDVAGMHCGWGTQIHAGRVPAQDATAVKRMKDAGAIVVGTLVSTEYAIAAAGPTVNPHDHTRSPGGSSSGPAAAVACGMVPVALGSQTVGSIVRPAAYCGVFGLKPTRGAIPGRGGMILSPRLDHPGIFARKGSDLAPLCRALFGHDPQDDTSSRILFPDTLPDLGGMRVFVSRSIPPEPVSNESIQAVEQAAARLVASGARIEPFEFDPDQDAAFDILHTIMTHDMAQAHSCDYDQSGDAMSARLRALIEHGRTVTVADYDAAVERAETWRREFAEMLDDRTVILVPATDGIAPPLEDGTGSNRPQALWSLVGLPVVAIPCATHAGLPLGVQVAAGPGRESCVIAIAKVFDS